MVEAHHIGASVRRKPDEVCPFVAKIVTNENVAILGDAVDDNLENRPAREALLIIGKNALLAGRASKQRFGDKVAQEILAAADERFVAKQGAVDIGEGDRKSTRLALQSLMRISYAVFCLKKKTNKHAQEQTYTHTHSMNDIKNICNIKTD